MEFFSRENKEFESNDSIKLQQNVLLKKHIEYLASRSPYYKRLFKDHSIDHEKIKEKQDLRSIPSTTKEDLEKFNSDFLCVDNEEICEYVTTSGTLGNPISIALSKSDLARLTYNEKRALEIGGISREDIVQITATLDKRFMAGMAYYLGSTDIGAAVIRTGIGNPGFQSEYQPLLD